MRPPVPPAIVTIDGPAGAGKTSVARALAERLGYVLLDSGALYRAVALVALERAIDLEDDEALGRIAGELRIGFEPAEGFQRCRLDGRDVTAEIRAPHISEAASRVSARPAVRAALLGLQRRVAEGRGVVAEGRDMGTVVFPDAPVKFFLIASPEERARRRTHQLRQSGLAPTQAQVREEQEARDRRDSEREVAPLRPATDAVVVDTTALSEDEVIEGLEHKAIEVLCRT